MGGLIRVAVRARGDEAEPLRARLLELAPAGLEERDAGGAVELAVYVAAEAADAVRPRCPRGAVA